MHKGINMAKKTMQENRKSRQWHDMQQVKPTLIFFDQEGNTLKSETDDAAFVQYSFFPRNGTSCKYGFVYDCAVTGDISSCFSSTVCSLRPKHSPIRTASDKRFVSATS